MNDLLVIETNNINELQVIFGEKDEHGKPKIALIVEEIERNAHSIVFDISTKEGQATCRSLASKIASAKSALDKAGKAKKDEYTVFTKLIDEDRNFVKTRLQALQDEIRQPLTDMENAEKQRIATHEMNVQALIVNDFNFTAQDYAQAIKNLESCQIDDSYQEFKLKALETKESELSRLRPLLKKAQQFEAEQAELQRLRQEQAQREQQEREQRIAQEAEARAKAEIEAKQRAEEAERIKREKDIAHRNQIMVVAKDDLVSNGIDEHIAEQVIKLIFHKQVRNVHISF